MSKKSPKILIVDIETSPMLAWVWGLFDQNIALNQIHKDWQVLSWSAKWEGEKKVMYMDKSKDKDDKRILKGIWALLDEADIVVGQNSKKFDIKKLNARFVLNDMPPPSSFRQIDTLVLARKYFALTSNKLEYMSEKLNKKYKKLKHSKFPGFALWTECMSGNKKAWAEMKAYNILDVLSTEELYKKFQEWGTGIDLNVYTDELLYACQCGGTDFVRNGYFYKNSGKFVRYKCKDCGSESKDKTNILSKEKRAELRF